jgi:catechol 2,3-dioxygenase-like lactoylglutathione lyase family enzyme
MPKELMYPILPCRDIDEAIAFYEALGFRRTYRQVRPNPYAVVARGDLQVHLGGIPGFDPAQSYASVIVVVPDPDALYHAFADGLRRAYGRLPVSGIPRITRPRKRYGTVDGFTVVDVGGNWLRVSRAGDTEESAEHADGGLPGVIEVSARLADAHGDVALALRTLESGLRRHSGASRQDRARALLYRAELAVRLGDVARARSSLDDADALGLTMDELALIEADRAHVSELVAEASPTMP